jgi:hypothetical protein
LTVARMNFFPSKKMRHRLSYKFILTEHRIDFFAKI